MESRELINGKWQSSTAALPQLFDVQCGPDGIIQIVSAEGSAKIITNVEPSKLRQVNSTNYDDFVSHDGNRYVTVRSTAKDVKVSKADNASIRMKNGSIEWMSVSKDGTSISMTSKFSTMSAIEVLM